MADNEYDIFGGSGDDYTSTNDMDQYGASGVGSDGNWWGGGGQSQMNTSNYSPYQAGDYMNWQGQQENVGMNPTYDMLQYQDQNQGGGQMSYMNQANYDPYSSGGLEQQQSLASAPSPEAAGAGGIQSFLQDLFNKKQTGSGGAAGMMGGMGSNIVKGLGGLLGSFAQSKSNTANTTLGNKVMQQMDPFGAQRAGYQQKLADTYTNPMGTLQRPEIAGQLAQMKAQMDARDATAGRRSQYGGRMNQLAEQQAKLMDSYRAQLGQFGGSQFAPNTSAGASILQGANNVNSNPMNPLIAAAGNIMKGDEIQQEKPDVLAQIQALLAKR
jgi:hypothetical protein